MWRRLVDPDWDEEFHAPGLCSLGGGGGQPSTQTVTQELAPEQRKLIEAALPAAQRFARRPPTLPEESGIAGFTPLQQEAQQATVDVARNVLPQQAQQTAASQAFLQSPALLFPQTNPALQASINAAIEPLFQNLTEQTLPNIGRQATTSGQFGGTRQGIAEGIASRGALQAAGQVSADLANQAFQRGLQANIGALALAPQTQQLAFSSPLALEAVGAQQQALEQAQLAEAQQRELARQILPFSAAQQVASLAFGFPGGSTTSTLSGGTVGGGFGQALGGALGGAGAGAALAPTLGATGPVGAGVGALVGLLGGIFG